MKQAYLRFTIFRGSDSAVAVPREPGSSGNVHSSAATIHVVVEADNYPAVKPILLIQARSEPHILHQERRCFLDRCQLDPSRLEDINVLDADVAAINLSRFSAVMIGGAGAYSAASDYPWTQGLLQFVRHCIEGGVPTFGSCWGHQIIARAAGGTVVHDSERAEMGSIWIELTPESEADPIFRLMPKRFRVNAGHHDRVSILPKNAIELARNESQPNQAFTLAGLPIYGTQFHSELDAETERERLIEYREHYRVDLPSDEVFDQVVASLAATTEADKLLRYFLDVCVLQ